MNNQSNKISTTMNARLRKCAFLFLVALLSAQLAGCCNVPKPNLFDGSLIDGAFGCYRDKVWAKRACNLRFANCDRPYPKHFQAGFEAGYTNICEGGDGYVPATPPECYWGFEYQTPDGAQCVNSWFEGYPAGVAAAKRDRAGTYRDVYVSRMIQSAIAQDKIPKTTPANVQVVDSSSAQIGSALKAKPASIQTGPGSQPTGLGTDPNVSVPPIVNSSLAPAYDYDR